MQTSLRKNEGIPIKFAKYPVGLMGGAIQANHLNWATDFTLTPILNLIKLSITVGSFAHFSQLPDPCFMSTKHSKYMQIECIVEQGKILC